VTAPRSAWGAQAINLRFRDGTIYQATATDPAGNYELGEVFPFFKWLVPEVDYLRFKATGMTTAVDYGGAITSQAWPANGNKSLQPQSCTQDDVDAAVPGATPWATPWSTPTPATTLAVPKPGRSCCRRCTSSSARPT